MKRLLVFVAFILAWGLFSHPLSASQNSLHQAVINHDLGTIKSLISQGADVDSRKWMFAKTPLMLAAENGFEDVTEILVNAGADLELRSRSRSTALHYAARNKHAATFHFLLTRGANPWAVNRRYETPYGLAVQNGWQDILASYANRQ